MITHLLRLPPLRSIDREDTRYPCRICGHVVFVELFRAPRDAVGRKDTADRELCERCGQGRAA